MPATPDDASMKVSTKPEESNDSEFSQSGDLTGDGGVVKEILHHGEQGWMKPESGDEVQMHYRGTLLDDGSEFDSSYSRNMPFSFKLGEGKVIKGWDIVGKTMAKGEKARVTLKPEYAYGETGSPPKIPKNATLVFEMELMSWTSQRDVFGDGLVLKTELNAGEGWERPGKMAEVTIDVTITQMDDSGRNVVKDLHQQEMTIALGSGQAPEVWEKVIPDMKKDGVLQLNCKAPRCSGTGIEHIVPMSAKCVRHTLRLVSWLKIEDVTNDGNLVKKILTEGDGWERPSEGAIATIDMKMYLPNKDSKFAVPPPCEKTGIVHEITGLEFKVGDGIVIDGLDRVVQSMKLKEEAMVCIAPTLAFDTARNLLTDDLKKKGVSESTHVVVDITLTKFEKARDVWSMSFEEKIDEMKVRKTRGNELFKDARYETAKKSYERAVGFFDSSTSDLKPEIKTQVNELLVSCHLNLAMCYDRMKDMTKVLTHCKKALEIQPSNVKALYRQGSAYLSIDDYYNAQSSLKYAKELNPGNPDVLRKLKELKAKRLKQDAADKKLFSNLFGRMTKLEDKEKKKVGVNGAAETMDVDKDKDIKCEDKECCKGSKEEVDKGNNLSTIDLTSTKSADVKMAES